MIFGALNCLVKFLVILFNGCYTYKNKQTSIFLKTVLPKIVLFQKQNEIDAKAAAERRRKDAKNKRERERRAAKAAGKAGK